MDENTALFIVIMTGILAAAALIAMWIRRRQPAAATENGQAARQIEALSKENSRLHDRIAVLERIATDPSERTARAIEQLRS